VFQPLKDGPDYSVRAVERVARLLAVLAAADSPQSLSAIAVQANLSVPTTFRLLRTLRDHDLVMTHQPQGRYTLGFRILEYGQALQRQLDIVNIARPHLVALRNETSETATLAVRSGDANVNIAQAESQQLLRRVKVLGQPTPLYVGAAGKVLLAALTDEEIDEYIGRTELVAYTPSTATEPARLWDQIKRARASGFSESVNERGVGGVGVAAPIRAHDGRVVAVLDLVAPLSRFTPETREHWIAVTMTAAREISRALGFSDRALADQTARRKNGASVEASPLAQPSQP
jgi:DNA-binding IclR family transcriptional regulator